MRRIRAMVAVSVAALLAAGCSSAATQHAATPATGSAAAAAIDAAPATEPDPSNAQEPPQPPMDPRFPGHWGIVRGSPRRIAGLITAGGKPVVATISLRGPLTAMGALPAIAVESGADGRFDLGEQPIAEWELVAQRDGFAPTVIDLDLAAAEPVDDLAIGLVACHRQLYGTVSSDAGPIAGAVVQRGDWGAAGATTDAQGRYQMCISDGVLRLAAIASGYMPAVTFRDIDGTIEVDFDLAAAVSVAARVVDEQGAAVAGALVLARGDDLALTQAAVSDADGYVRFDGAGLTTRLLAERVPPLGPLAVGESIAVAESPGQSVDATITVEPGVLLTGHLEDRGHPLADTTVRLTSEEGWVYAATSRIDGSFEIWGAPVGPLEVSVAVSVDGRGWREAELSASRGAGQPRTMRIDADGSGMIRGRVIHRGRGVARAEVNAPSGAEQRSATDGTFWLEASDVMDSGPGNPLWALGRSFEACGRVALDKDVAYYVSAGIVIDLTETSTVEGVVVDETGAPVAGAVVALENASSTDFAKATTGPDGHFYAQPLNGGESYAVTVYSNAERTEVHAPARGKRLKALHLDADGGQLRNVKLAVRRTPEALDQLTPSAFP